METRKNRMSVGGLRRSAPSTLQVLTADVIRLPLGQIDPGTLLDLVALSEIPEQLPGAMGRDLAAFREQMFREIADLPDGPALAEFATELSRLPARATPSSLREAVVALLPERRHADAIAALRELFASWEVEQPEDLVLPDEAARPARPSRSSTRQVVPAAGKPRARRAPSVPAPLVDDRREEWVREDVMSRLVNYGPRGLKEPVVVAGARHRAPWKDLSEAEVLTVLRKLKRDGLVRFSAGRWIINR